MKPTLVLIGGAAAAVWAVRFAARVWDVRQFSRR